MTTSEENHPTLDLQIISNIRMLDDLSTNKDGISHQFLELVKDENSNGVCINGNWHGLVHLARIILDIAEKKIPGKHQHLDEFSGLDLCELPLTICYKQAEWD